MSGNVWRLDSRAAFVASAFLAFICASSGSTARPGVPFDLSWRPTPVAFPAGLTRVSDDFSSNLVSAVTADIDSDGDLDVVATDRALNLLVWVNDGAGHFTRQRPKRGGGFSTRASGPTLERRSGSVAVSTLNDPPSAGLGQRPSLDAKLPGATRPPTTDRFVLPSTASYCPSRAPPLDTRLT